MLSPEQRARLAAKGRILYRKTCGIAGTKTCARSFVLFHLGRGEAIVAWDLLAFLDTEAQALRRMTRRAAWRRPKIWLRTSGESWRSKDQRVVEPQRASKLTVSRLFGVAMAYHVR